ncbi:unnamed protein product [Heligmosomoides polygyrus]|uniref:Uncharacterized protein n=1 Tax=Heligmosomoides polygyrus TaxID=6339 RepID=A0A183FHZ6_HELPZ|nr:unnamed protein product [Heligmosomoides polygyrus]
MSSRGRGLKPRDAYGTGAYDSRAFFELNHGRLLANYILGCRSPKFTRYSRCNASGYEWGSSAERRESEDIPQTSSKVRRDSEDLMKMPSNLRQDSEDVLEMSFNLRRDPQDVLKASFNVSRDSEDVPQTSNLSRDSK